MATKAVKLFSAIKQKPYYSAADFVLYHADYAEILSQLPDESIDLIFADPPYNLSNGGFTCHNGRAVSVNKGKWDKSQGFSADFQFHLDWITACRRVLKPAGSLWVSGTYHSIYQCGTALQQAGYQILNDIAWYKPNASPNLSCRYFTASHETLIWARKDKNAKHTFNYEVMRDWEENYRRFCQHRHPIEILHQKGKQMRSVWAILTPRKEEKVFGKHPTQKPFELLKRVVAASSKPGDIVLDPFTGSSTTGLAASLYDRHFIGVDREEEYLKLSVKRHKHLGKNKGNHKMF